MSDYNEYIVACNGAPLLINGSDKKFFELEYRPGKKKNVNIDLQKFVNQTYKLKSERYKDLLEIAGYIFAADRRASRGGKEAAEYHGWSRLFHFHFNVRDYNFWNNEEVKSLLSEALKFMTGDFDYQFTFYDGGNFPENLFDTANFELDPEKDKKFLLFSGGLDSLAGVIETIKTSKDEICLVSHQSGQPGVKSTQNRLYEEIDKRYPGRCKHYKFHCSLSKTKSKDETQRTRAFLYNTIAFVLASTYGNNNIYVYENGITTINFAKTQDLILGRASRTTHPKTLGLLEEFFEKVGGERFIINQPFLFNTKTDVICKIKQYSKLELLRYAVTCGKTRNHPAQFKHCGYCGQCIDRIFAGFATEAEEFDEGTYYRTFFKDGKLSKEIKGAVNNYLRLADECARGNLNYFYDRRGTELLEIMDYIKGEKYEDKLEKIFSVFCKHSKQIEHAIHRMSEKYDNPFEPPKPFYSEILGKREYKKRNIKTDEKFEVIENEKLQNYESEEFIESDKDYEMVNNELSNAQVIIKRQQRKIKTLEVGITKGGLERMIDDNKCRKKNGKINFSALGKIMGCTHHTAKAKCEYYGIS